MKSTLKVAFLILLYFVSLSVVSRAQAVHSYTDIVHYNWDGHNEMLGVAFANIDYEIYINYCTFPGAILERFEDGVGVDVGLDVPLIECPYAYPWQGNPYSQASASLPYISTSDYEVTGSQTLRPIYENGTYFDPHRFSEFDSFGQEGLPITSPLAYSFLGIGPPVWVDYNSFILGYVNAYREALSTTTSNNPHHLKVDKDSFEATSPCGGVRRKMKYAIVDESGKKVGRIVHREFLPQIDDKQCFPTFPQQPITGCYFGTQGGQYVGLNNDNPFEDELTAGCSYPEPHCGAKVTQTWNWCQATNQFAVFNTSVILATIPSEARTFFVKVKERPHSSPWPKGTEFKETP